MIEKRKKILVICYSYFPEQNPRAYRWTPILEFMSQNQYEIDVICSKYSQGKMLEKINGVNVFRTGKSIKSLFAGKNAGIKKGSNKNTCLNLKSKCLRILKIIYDRTWKKLYWPDYTCIWYFYAYSKAKTLARSNRYDAMISVSHPFNDHLIALKLKTDFPELKWIIDIGDPFCFLTELPSNNYKLYSKLNYFYEKKVFIACDKVAVTTKETKEIYADLFPESKEKIVVIPPLVPKDLIIKENNNEMGDNKIKLVFVGTLYRNIRSPEYLLKIYNSLLYTEYFPMLELHFYGNMDRCDELFEPYKNYIGSKIFIHGHVGRNIVQQAINNATILVNIGNTTFYQLPSKVVEYVNTGKPIINISKIENDSSSGFFKIYSRCLNINETEDIALESQCRRLFEFIKNPPEEVNQAEIETILRPYQLNSIVEEYGKLLNKV